jgi:RNA polymerase sigma factor (sigma-70 family)
MSHESVRSTRSPRSRSSSEARLERALFERVAATGDPRAREALVERYLPLARSLALRYQRSFESIDDLFQVASVGLVKAVDGFDPDRGIAFSSYAVPTILGEIKRHFRDRTWAVRVPRDLQELSLRVDGVCESGFERAEDRATTEALMRMLTERERDILRMRFVEDMTQAEIGEVAGISQMQVSRIIRQAIARMHAVATHRMAEYALD